MDIGFYVVLFFSLAIILTVMFSAIKITSDMTVGLERGLSHD